MKNLDDFLTQYANSSYKRFHMPGHKGRAKFLYKLGARYDITEITGADYLYKSKGLIANLEDELESIYNSTTAISCGGATLSIQTALSFIPKSANLFAMRQSHISFFNACALLGLKPKFISASVAPSQSACIYKQLKHLLKKSNKPAYVFITSPNYYGQMCDIKKISDICRNSGAKLIVDNSHGSHLKFLQKDLHPITLGADICCDSLHKTLPVLTGGALLHVKRGFITRAHMKEKMSLFGSTSPSYLLLCSIDLFASWIKSNGRPQIIKAINKIDNLKNINTVSFLDTEPFKITIDCLSNGITGNAGFSYLLKNKIQSEFCDNRFVTLMASAFTSTSDLKKLKKSLLLFPKNLPIKPPIYTAHIPEKVLNIKKAISQKSKTIDLKDALLKVSAKPVYAFPPGIPIVLPGERIDRTIIELLKRNGNLSVDVVE